MKTYLWRRGLIRNNYFPLIFVCYIKQLFTALMMLSSKRSIFSLSKRCYGNMKIWMSCTSRLWKIKRRNLCCCVDFYFIQASSDYFGTLYDMLQLHSLLRCKITDQDMRTFFLATIRIPPVGALSKSRILLDKLLCHCTRLNLTCLLAQSGGKSVWGSRKKGSRHGFYICFILPVLNLRPVVFANSLVGSV